MVTLTEAEDGVLEIRRDSETVGYIQATENTLTQIDILPEYQDNGYATDALQKFLQQKKNDGYTEVRTTAVVSSTFERILLRANFTQTDDEMANTYKYTF